MLTFYSVFLDELIRYLWVYSFDETQLFTKSLATRLYSVLEFGGKEQDVANQINSQLERQAIARSAARSPARRPASYSRSFPPSALPAQPELKFLEIGLCTLQIYMALWTKLQNFVHEWYGICAFWTSKIWIHIDKNLYPKPCLYHLSLHWIIFHLLKMKNILIIFGHNFENLTIVMGSELR